MSENTFYDVIVIGGGPAGLSASLYSARDRFRTLVLEKNGLPGGQIMLTDRIENYPGYARISGPDLVSSMHKQVLNFGAEVMTGQGVTKLTRRGDGMLEVTVNDGEQTHLARGVILAPGSDYRKLNVPGEDEMRQAGKVSYCATCDGAFYRDKHVLTVGGGNTAVEDTIYLASHFTGKTTMIHRRAEFRAQQVLVEELYDIAGKKNIDIKLSYVVEAIVGNGDMSEIEHVTLRNVQSGHVEKLHVDGVFVFVGMIPHTDFLRGALAMDQSGFILCDCTTLKTSLRGVLVAGDCRQQAAMQLATACGDGVLAAMEMKEYLRNPKSWAKTMDAKGLVEGW